MRLAGVAQYFQAYFLRGQCHAGEINMGGDVFQANTLQRVAVTAVRLVTHECAHMALRMVVLGFWKTIVDQEHCAHAQTLTHAANKRLSLRMNFGQVIVLALDLDRWTLVCNAVLPSKTAGRLVPHHATLEPKAARVWA